MFHSMALTKQYIEYCVDECNSKHSKNGNQDM